MRRRHHIFFLLCLLSFSKAHAQNIFKNPSYNLQGFYGSFLTRLPKAQYLRDSYTYFGEFSIMQQTDGRKDWQLANGLPQVGVAFFYGNTGSKKYMGNMAGLFPFVNWKLYQKKLFASSLRTGAGLGWIQKPYNKTGNHKNVLIGTHGNAYLNFLWQAEVRLLPAVHIQAGLGFSHFSNGSSTLPNLGLNIPAVSLGLRYGAAKKSTVPQRRLDSLKERNAFFLFTTAGIKQFPWIESKRYMVNILQAEWSRRLRYIGKLSGGAMLFYDRSREVDPAGILDHKQTGKNVQAGVFAGYEHLFGRLSVPVQLGAYVYNQGIHSALFQQLGFRYRITRHWSAQLAMKIHSGKADFIHLGIGCRLK